jgi:hypothetical protein
MSNFDCLAIGTGPCGGIQLTITNCPFPSLSMLCNLGSHELNLSLVPRNYRISRDEQLGIIFETLLHYGLRTLQIQNPWLEEKNNKVISSIYIEGVARPTNWEVWNRVGASSRQLWWSITDLMVIHGGLKSPRKCKWLKCWHGILHG